jgi:hypothetical protein
MLTENNVGMLSFQDSDVFGTQVTTKPFQVGSVADKSHERFLTSGPEFGVLIPFGSSATNMLFPFYLLHIYFNIFVEMVISIVIRIDLYGSWSSSGWSEEESSIINMKIL